MGGDHNTEHEFVEALQNVTRRCEGLVQILSILREMDQLDDPLHGLQTVCCHIVGAIASSLAAENCSLFLLDETGEHVELRATCSPLEDSAKYFGPGGLPPRKFRLGEGIAGTVAETRRPVCVTDSSEDARYKLLSGCLVSPRSLLCFPLIVEDRGVGVLNLSHSRPGFFNSESEHTLSFVADRAARMLANHLLHERVRQSEEHYRLILETADDAVLVFDKSGHVTEANHAVETLTGIQARSFVSGAVTWESRIHPEDLGPFRKHLEELLSDRRPVALQYRCMDVGGRVHSVEERCSPFLSPEGGVDGFVCVVRDVSERKLAEEELLQAQKMECVGRLAGGIAHDFNNLLTIICGYGEVLHGQLEAMPAALGRLRYIEEAAERAGQLVRQLLAFSRKQVLQPKVMDLNASLTDTIKMLRRVLGDDVQLITRFSPEPVPILIDPVHLTQVVMNLAVNARDAMEGGGVLTLETSRVEVGEKEAARPEQCACGPYARLAVGDTGTGMSEEVLGKIFQPFFTTKLNGTGTGLGLATVNGIVEQNGGFMTVESEVGSGSTFHIHLPLVAEQAQSAGPPAVSAPLRGNETVLVVEDQRAVRELIVQMLTRQGFNVLQSASAEGAAALAEDQSRRIDLLLTDFLLPGMNGYQLATELCKKQPQLKVLIMSGYAGQTAADQALCTSGHELLQKPFTSPELIKRVREMLDTR